MAKGHSLIKVPCEAHVVGEIIFSDLQLVVVDCFLCKFDWLSNSQEGSGMIKLEVFISPLMVEVQGVKPLESYRLFLK